MFFREPEVLPLSSLQRVHPERHHARLHPNHPLLLHFLGCFSLLLINHLFVTTNFIWGFAQLDQGKQAKAEKKRCELWKKKAMGAPSGSADGEFLQKVNYCGIITLIIILSCWAFSRPEFLQAHRAYYSPADGGYYWRQTMWRVLCLQRHCLQPSEVFRSEKLAVHS